MQQVPLGSSSLQISRLAYGCWRIAGSWDPSEVTPATEAAGRRAIWAAFEAGYTVFDHADIYCRGVAETLFGKVLQEAPGTRDRIVILTKCGIRPQNTPAAGTPTRYDFRADYIIDSCEQSLRRLRIETIDVYQLHRPDYLMNPEEVAGAFDRLRKAGKVREFGVSNFRPSQFSALQKACPMRLLVNQIEISLSHLSPFEDGSLDHCLQEKITPFAWSPLGGGHLGDGARRVLPSQQGYFNSRLVAALDRVADDRGATRPVVALAWLLKHPAGIVPIVGSTDPERIRNAAAAASLHLSHEEWYELLTAARAEPLP
ncbi:MAG: aldo/keto reductase [Verrucomicrobia bacterium]|nr:aldo/keto reductase [Verrucomicrobiota bacterium]MBI3869271.1 aldo/keto reductase [Verrucomicrobiota bacterium]